MSVQTDKMLLDAIGRAINQWYDTKNDIFREISPQYPLPVSQALKVGRATGATITTGSSSAYVAIPLNAAGERPNWCRLAATKDCYVKVGHGGDAAATASLKAINGVISSKGAGYAVNDTVTLAGGTSSTKALLTVNSTSLATVDINAIGSGYLTGDTVALAGGTANTKAVVTLDSTQLVSMNLRLGSSGYAANDTITLANGTTSDAAVVTVTSVDGGGAITAFSISHAGEYTVESASFTQASTSGSGVGATFDTALYGIKTFHITTAGQYTVNTATFTQYATSGAGTGATFQNALFGINSAIITNGGKYSAIPSNAVSQFATSGSGTGAQFTVTWGVGIIDVSVSGVGYLAAPAITFTGGSGTGAAATANLDVNGSVTSVTTTSSGTGYTSPPTVVFATDISAVAGDMLIQAGTSALVDTTGFAHIAAIQLAEAGTLQISALENS